MNRLPDLSYVCLRASSARQSNPRSIKRLAMRAESHIYPRENSVSDRQTISISARKWLVRYQPPNLLLPLSTLSSWQHPWNLFVQAPQLGRSYEAFGPGKCDKSQPITKGARAKRNAEEPQGSSAWCKTRYGNDDFVCYNKLMHPFLATIGTIDFLSQELNSLL